MTDLERVRDRLAGQGHGETQLAAIIDAHLKEDAEREARLRTFMSEDYAAQVNDLLEMLNDKEAELDRLREQRDSLQDALWEMQAENARLREALTTIAATEEGQRLFGGLLRNALRETP